MSSDKPQVLIVEDDKSYQMLFKDKLAEAGLLPTVAGSKSAAEEKVSNQPDIILLDYTLPDGTGQEVLEVVRSKEGSWSDTVPILMFTQHDEPEKIAESVSAGAQADPEKGHYGKESF